MRVFKYNSPMQEIIEAHGFTKEEYQKILEYLGREPNLLELGIFSTSWSEHCSYKSSKPVLRTLHTKGERILQGPGENAGVLYLDDELGVAFKVESHNHPSAVEPFHGAATGIGGIIRDVISMGARPIALLDSLRFGPLTSPRSRQLFEGVVSGISFYGNCIGVPTVGGEVYFDEPYEDNCLVNVMAVGLVKLDKIKMSRAGEPGNLLVLIGNKTGRDGIHGATFASEDLVGEVEKKVPNVQVGDPFMEKLLIEATMEIIEIPEVDGIQDLGAGGLSTTPPEMASKSGVGVEIDVNQVPTRSRDMTPYEVLLSESQERMVISVKPEGVEKVRKVAEKWDIDFAVIGRVIEERVFRIVKDGETIAEIPIDALTEGVPVKNLPVKRPEYLEKIREIQIVRSSDNLDEKLLKLISHPSIASKEWVYTQYDHMVGTNTVLLPGHGDAAVLRIKGKPFGIAVTIDGNGKLVYLDPFEGGKNTVLEAMRNLVAVGARPIGITDGLNFANPNDPEVFWTFKEAVRGMNEVAKFFNVPFVSGNVSFYNQSETRKIYPTPIVGMVGFLEDIEKRMDMQVKAPGDLIFVVGKETGKIGGSIFLDVFYGDSTGKIDTTDLDFEEELQERVLLGIENGIFTAVHDVSDGGLLVAIAEMLMYGELGTELTFRFDEVSAFGEWQSRFVVTVSPVNLDKFKKIMGTMSFELIGRVTDAGDLRFNEYSIPLDEIKSRYFGAIPDLMK